MIDEYKMRPLEIQVAKKLCSVDGAWIWKFLRAKALDGSSEHCLHEYRRYLRMARAAVLTVEKSF